MKLAGWPADSVSLRLRSAFHIFVVEQARDGRKFNRGKLLNAGFDITRGDFDVFIFHDVDLLPGVRSEQGSLIRRSDSV